MITTNKTLDKLPKTFVIGDIHGAYKSLKQCLERSEFDYENDILISLGDICDGWNEVYECIEELLKIKNLIIIKGNHDDSFIHWMNTGKHIYSWLQGAYSTAESYIRHADRKINIYPHNGGFITDLTYIDLPVSHREFFNKMKYYYIDSKNRGFVHGGFDRHFTIPDNVISTLMWDRELFNQALSHSEKDKPFKIKGDYTEVYIGHTTTEHWGKIIPMKAANIWNLDTGAGWTGKLTIMNIDTKEYYQSDIVTNLYSIKTDRSPYG